MALQYLTYCNLSRAPCFCNSISYNDTTSKTINYPLLIRPRQVYVKKRNTLWADSFIIVKAVPYDDYVAFYCQHLTLKEQ